MVKTVYSSRRSRAPEVVSSQRTGVVSVGRETSDSGRVRLVGRQGEGGGGGGAGEGVVINGSMEMSHMRRPGEYHMSLSNNCLKNLWSICWSYRRKNDLLLFTAYHIPAKVKVLLTESL